jgi:hypothetical protein
MTQKEKRVAEKHHEEPEPGPILTFFIYLSWALLIAAGRVCSFPTNSTQFYLLLSTYLLPFGLSPSTLYD